MWTEAQYVAASERADDLGVSGRREEAQAVVEEALAQARDAGDEGFVLFFEAELAWLQGNYQDQLALYERANGVRPNCHLILRNIAKALGFFSGQHLEALDWFDKALAVAPDDIESQRSRAIILGISGKEREAAAGLRECLARNPADAEAKMWLASFAPPEEALVAIQELEEQRRLREQQRSQAEREARERQIRLDAWRSLSARSAHRIGNQLFASRGALRTLKKMKDPEAAEAVADLEGSLDRIRRIVQEFQAFSTNEEPRLLQRDIGPLVRETVRRYSGLGEGVELSADIAERLPVCLLDRDQIEQAVGELLENAAHHTPAGGRIRVTAEAIGPEGGRRVRVVVADTGPGVAGKDKERIFTPFISTRPGGSGLGLAIVRQIVENHGGTIRETGKAGEGARFEIALPAGTSEETPA